MNRYKYKSFKRQHPRRNTGSNQSSVCYMEVCNKSLKESGSTRQITTINPATEEVVNTYEIMTIEAHNAGAHEEEK